MVQLPMFPGWDAIHPMLIHFPLTLFLLVPVFVLTAALSKAAMRQAFFLSSLIVMLLGIISIQMAYDAGQSAAAVIPGRAAMVLENHREWAGLARSSLTLATLLFGLTLLLALALHVPLGDLSALLPLGSAAFYVLGVFWLVRAAHQGERLVHEFGVGVVGP